MQQVAIGVVKPDHLPWLVQRPGGRGVRRCVEMEQSAWAAMDHDKCVDQPEGRCDRHEEVAVDGALGMVLEQGRPSLIASRVAWPWL